MAKGIVVSLEVIGGDKVLQGLAAFQEVVKDLRPFWREEFAPRYFRRVQDKFNTSGRSRSASGRFAAGGAWAPLSPRYKAWKEQHYPGQPILVREGPLRESVTWAGNHLGPDGVFEAYPRYVVFGTRVKYAKYHQHGTDLMPARPFMEPPDPAIYAPMLRQWITRTAKQRGAKLKG